MYSKYIIWNVENIFRAVDSEYPHKKLISDAENLMYQFIYHIQSNIMNGKSVERLVPLLNELFNADIDMAFALIEDESLWRLQLDCKEIDWSVVAEMACHFAELFRFYLAKQFQRDGFEREIPIIGWESDYYLHMVKYFAKSENDKTKDEDAKDQLRQLKADLADMVWSKELENDNNF